MGSSYGSPKASPSMQRAEAAGDVHLALGHVMPLAQHGVQERLLTGLQVGIGDAGREV